MRIPFLFLEQPSLKVFWHAVEPIAHPALSMMKHRGDASAGFSKCLQLGHSRMLRRGDGAACAILCAQITQPNRVFSMVLLLVWTAILSAK
jgi:hypothetical protein